MSEFSTVPPPDVPPPIAGAGSGIASTDALTAAAALKAGELLRQSENLKPSNAPDPGQTGDGRKKAKKTPKPTRLEVAVGDLAAFFELETTACQTAAMEVVKLESHCGERLYSYLERCFKFVLHQRFDEEKFVKYCLFKKLKCTKATRANRHLCAIRAAGRDIKNKQASKYAKALLYVENNAPEGCDVVDFLREKGGVEGCLKLARLARQEQGAAQTHGAARRLAIIGFPADLKGTVSIIVTIKEGQGHFVKCTTSETETAPPDPPGPIEGADSPPEAPAGEEVSEDV